jgi:hypothetical protein
VTKADRLRFVFQCLAEGLMFTLLFCLLGVLTLQLASGPEAVKDPSAAVPRTLPGSAP